MVNVQLARIKLSNMVRSEYYGENFYERYYKTARRTRVARFTGRRACSEIIKLNDRLDDEVESTIVESLHGRVASEYSFECRNGKIIAADGEVISDLLERAVIEADRMAVEDDYYADFLPQRTRNELAELHLIESLLGQREGINVVCVVSPYSEEFDDGDGKLDRAFQRSDCKRAMLRLTYIDGDKVHILTRSLDFASVHLLALSAKEAMGYTYRAADSTAMQGESIVFRAESLSDIRVLADKFVSVYDALSLQRKGIKTHQGRSISDDANLHLLVSEKCDPIKESVRKELKEAAQSSMHAHEFKQKADAILFNHIALADRLIRGQVLGNDISHEALTAGTQASIEGTTYNACGVVLDGGNIGAGLSAMTGYESLMQLSKKHISCPDCRKKVTVEDKLLKEGILHCTECGNTVDVCGDKEKARRFKESLVRNKSRHKKATKAPTSLFSLLFGKQKNLTGARSSVWPF